MRGIYWIRNKIDGKYYIGSSIDIERRWNQHKQDLRADDHLNSHLQNAWNKYGEESFIFEVIKEIEDDSNLILIEQGYLDNGFSKGILYNIAQKAGGGNFGEEVNDKISKALKGRVSPTKGMIFPQGNLKLRQYLKIHGSHLKGKILSEEHIQKVKLGLARHYEMHAGPMKGKHHTKDTKIKMSRARKGKTPNAKLYPALYNEQTNQFIPEGVNFTKLCRDRGLNFYRLSGVVSGSVRCTRDGWRLAGREEIELWHSKIL